MATVIAETKERNVPGSKVSQVQGIMLLTDSEILEMVALGKGIQDRSLFICGAKSCMWDIGKQASTQTGSIVLASLRGADQVRFALEDVLHGADLGIKYLGW